MKFIGIILALLLAIFVIFFAVKFISGNSGDENSTESSQEEKIVLSNDCEEKVCECNYEKIALKAELLEKYLNLAFASEEDIDNVEEYAQEINTLVEKIDEKELTKEFDKSVAGEDEDEKAKNIIEFLSYLSKSIQKDVKE